MTLGHFHWCQLFAHADRLDQFKRLLCIFFPEIQYKSTCHGFVFNVIFNTSSGIFLCIPTREVHTFLCAFLFTFTQLTTFERFSNYLHILDQYGRLSFLTSMLFKFRDECPRVRSLFTCSRTVPSYQDSKCRRLKATAAHCCLFVAHVDPLSYINFQF